MKKRILSILLCLTMFVTLMPTTAWADNADDPDPQEEVIQEQPSPEDGDPLPEEPAPEEDEPAPALTAPEIEVRPNDEETSSDMVLSVPDEWDSYAWEAYFGGEWIPCDGETSAKMVLNKEIYVQYGFRCTVTKDGQSVTTPAYAYDDAVWESSGIMRYNVRNSGSNSLTGSSAFIQFYKNSRNRFDIQGIDGNNGFKTTFNDGGYRTAVSVEGGSKVEVAYTGAPAIVGPSLTAQTALSVVYGGRYVQITYTVTNNGSTAKTFQIGSSADVMIDNNDKAEVKGSTTGLTMSGTPKNNYTFNLVAPTCDTLWYGYWTQAYDNIFQDLADKKTPYSKDSGMAWSWNSSVAPGETWTRYVLIGAGELPASPKPPTMPDLQDRTVTAGAEETFTGTGEAGTTVHITVAGQETSAKVGDDGKFTASITIPASYVGDTAAVTYWATSNEGGISAMNTAKVNVLRQPQVTLTTNATTVMEEDTLDENWYNSFIKSFVGDVTHTTINTNTNTPGTYYVTYTAKRDGFTDATANLTVKVLPKPAELTQTTATKQNSDFALSATMTYTGGLNYSETGFVYGALQNPTLTLKDGYVETASVVDTKGGNLTATLAAGTLTEGITYYARAYAKAADGTVIYGPQSGGFGLGVPSYGTFSVTNNGDNTFTIIRTGGRDGEQTVYYRTVNGSAIGGTHFTHAADSVTFNAGEISKTITIAEQTANTAYTGKPATAYSNADRTYQLEIYRVEGGATIDAAKDTATRTMAKNDNYTVDRQMFNAYQSTAPSGETQRGDYNDDKLGWTDSDTIGSAASRTVDFSNILPKREYWQETAQKLLYKFSMQAKEAASGYQHIQLVTGSSIDTSFFPYDGKYRAKGTSTQVTSLNGTGYTAFYAATFEHGGTSQNTSYATYYFPNSSGSNPSNCNISEISKNGAIEGDHFVIGAVVNGALQIGSSTNSNITVGFGGSGDNSDKWYSNQETHYFKLEDTREPQLLGIAPMGDSTFLPGQSITVSLVFDEIVDSQNSTLSSSSTITTNWGTFTYAGGADTNVLYFTGTVPETTNGTISLTTLDCAGQIKDMCDNTGGTPSSGSGSTTVTVGTAAKPTVSVGTITNSDGTLTATVSGSDKLEYVWSDSPTAPTTGWQIITSGKTAATRQAIGTWYLHARATNNDGWVVYAKQSYTLSGGGTVTLPNLTLSVDNSVWAKERAITVTPSPESATVKVSGPGISEDQTVSGDAYIATQNGVYTFTLTSGDETVTKTATVSKLDTTAPTVAVNNLTNTTHTEAVTLTVTAADTESGLAATPLTVTWTKTGGSSQAATFTGSGGTWTTTSPDESGEWKLSVTATDAVGNTASATSAVYTINADRPTITVNQTSSSNTGVTYSYSVNANGNTGVTVQLPDDTTTDVLNGTFTITEPGTYSISVTDAAGHFVFQPITVEPPSEGTLDGVKPDVRCDTDPWTWTNGNVTVTVNIYEAGGLSTVTWSKDGETAQSLPPTGEAGSYTASFTATANGTYTVTATDRVGNEGKATVTIDFIDKTEPTMTAKIGTADIDGSKWYSAAQTVTLTAADGTGSGVKSVEYAVTEKKDEPNSLKPLPDSKEVSVSGDGTHYIYYKVTDNAGNELTDWTNAIQINTTTPTLSVTGGTTGAASLTLTPEISGTEATVTVSKNGGTAENVPESGYEITDEGTYIFTATSNAGLTDTKTVTVYAITFNSAGGSIVAKQLVVSGGRATQPTAPTKAGYTFSRWQKDGSAFDFGTPITATTDLTAVWTLDAPMVTLGADHDSATYNGGSTVITLTATVNHAVSDLTYTYEWYKGSTKPDGQTASTLELKTVADSGSYMVKVTASKDGLTSSQVASSAVSVIITKATPSISTNPTASAITYGQSLFDSALSGGTASTEGSFKWEDNTIKPAVANSNTTEYSVIFTPTDTANYTTVTTTVKLTVNKKELTPSVTAAAGKIYDGNTSTTGTLSLDGAVFNEQPTATGTFTFVDKNVGTNKAVKVTGITLSGTWGDNYRLSTTALSDVATSAVITPAEVGLTWSGHENLTYTGYPVSVTATATGLIGEDACTVTVDGGAQTNAGTYTAMATGLSNANYRLPTAVTQGYTIAKAPVSFTVTDNTLSYDSTDRAATVAQAEGQAPSVGNQFTVSYKQDGTPVTPKYAGTYEVWVTLTSDNFKFDGQEDTTRNMKVGTLTINKKAALAVWTNLTQVYDGTSKTPTVTLTGQVAGDGSSFTVSAATNAGTHTVTLTPQNPAAESYIISNPMTTMVIQKAPVIFTVANNAAQYDGGAHTATVTASPAAAHTVTYRLKGQTVAAPTEAGTYEVWAEITDANYRHADATDGAARKIGVLTIYRQAAPTTYTATFAGGDGATGTAPAPQSGLLAGSVIVLPNAGSLTKADHAFAGWKLGNVVYQSGETYTMPAGNVTFTAQWKTNVYTINGVVDQNNQPLDHVTVTLMLGGQQIAETVTDSNGQYTFSSVIPGIYNLVASRDGVTMTIKVEITAQNASADIQLPAGKTNSIVEVKPGAATAVVGNLETVFTDNAIYTVENQIVVADGGSVEIKLTVDKTELTDEQTRDMQNKAGGYTLGQELTLTVEKIVTESGGAPTTTNISDTGVLLETTLLLPAELQGKDSYTVLRLHDGAVHTLTTSPNDDGEFFEVSADKTTITIHARYYSAYVIAWRQYSYGGGGTTTYPIALPDSTPDGGTVSVSPKSAPKGSTITITVDPDDGYELDQLTVKDKNGNKLPVTAKGNGKYTFEMPSGGVTIEAAFKESVWNRDYSDCLKDNTCPIWPYTDARMTDWYHDGVHFCLENSLMVGYGDRIFQPDAPTTRSMLIVMLWRLNGSPEVNYALDFEDVKEDAWYTEAVRWAKSEGVAGGYGNGKFGPSDTLTREQMVVMLYRYAQYKGYDVSVGENTNILSYGDATTVAEYAVPAMRWACGSGIVGGMDAANGSGLILDPKGSTTRAQMATVMMRFCAEIIR